MYCGSDECADTGVTSRTEFLLLQLPNWGNDGIPPAIVRLGLSVQACVAGDCVYGIPNNRQFANFRYLAPCLSGNRLC